MNAIKGLARVGVVFSLSLIIPVSFEREFAGWEQVSTGFAAQDAWVPVGGPVKNSRSVYVDVDASRHARGPVIAAGNSGLFLAWTEINAQGVSQLHFGEWDGKQWTMDPSPLNLDRDHQATELTLGTAGGNPILAWVEWDRRKKPLVYTGHRNKGTWELSENPVNLDPLKQSANPVIAGNRQSDPFLAWSERDHNRVFQLHVKQFSNSGWFSVGQESLNQNPSFDSIEPDLALDGDVPYVAWMELSENQVYQVWVKIWTGASWSPVGSSLNMDRNHHALRPSIGILNHQPAVAWTEINPSGVSTLHVKRWTGEKWEALGSALNMDSSRHSLSPVLKAAGENLYLAWGEYNEASHSRIFIRKWSGGRWESLASPLDAAGNELSVSPSLTPSKNGIYLSWKEVNADGFFQVSVKHKAEK
ncbi:MAG TPA: hypothetical protein VIU33_05955 [Nitrospiria bacterium]